MAIFRKRKTPSLNPGDDSITRGVYFIANDNVLDMAIAFLNSFRCFNPTINLCLIPYDDDFAKIEALQHEFRFSIFNDQKVLAACDEVSEQFHGHRVGAYRKLAVWTGPFAEFVYIDIDTIIHASFDFVFPFLKDTQILTSHSNDPNTRRWVWKDAILTHKTPLNDKQIAFAANTGFIVSTKSAMELDWVLASVDAGLDMKDLMELDCMEQPFLNYLIVTSGKSYNSLSCLRLKPWTPRELWAGIPGARILGNKLISPYGRPILFVHWAGVWRSRETLNEMPYQDLWLRFRNMSPNLPTFL